MSAHVHSAACSHGHEEKKMSDAYAVFKAKEAFKPWSFELHALQPNDVEIRISHCGMCHSDIHTIDGDWGDQPWPIVPGHEIIGTVTVVGPAVKDIKVGMRVGVGPQAFSCRDCTQCKSGYETYCEKGFIGSYGSNLADGYVTKGGYALYNRTDAHFVFPIPDNLDSAATAPILCAGITTFTPLKELGVKEGTKVAVIGIGGLGHMALQFARAMGAEVTAISSSANKEQEAKGFGAHHFVNSSDPAQFKAAQGKFNVLVNTVSSDLPWDDYIKLLYPHGTFVQLGVPKTMNVSPSTIIFGSYNVRGSLIGPPGFMNEMLQLCSKANIKAAVEVIPLEKVEEGRAKMMANKARYRVVLEMPK